jgi:hypothetical protein
MSLGINNIEIFKKAFEQFQANNSILQTNKNLLDQVRPVESSLKNNAQQQFFSSSHCTSNEPIINKKTANSFSISSILQDSNINFENVCPKYTEVKNCETQIEFPFK